MDDDQQFCLRWNNHQSTLVAVFDTLLENGTLVDCTLAAEGKYLNAHKVVLSACSPYFEALLSKHFDKHPIVVLKDVKFQELKAMMDYMYRGEVNISQDQLGALLKAAESLQIKGLSDNKRGETERKPVPAAAAPPAPKSPPPAPAVLPKVQGLTIEQRASRDDSRDGSASPGPRKKKRMRRKSEELDNHDASNSSESHSLPAAQTPLLPAKDTPEPVETKSEILTRHKQPDEMLPQVPILKEKMETHTELMLEPKSEYVDEMNEDSIEDLTLDDDDLSNMEQMDDQAGPSHGNAGEGSSQGFGGWHMGNQSQDEVFLAAQEAVGAHRDSQGNVWIGQRNVFQNGLEDLLMQNPDGRVILYNKNKLDNNCRKKLVRIIIDYLLVQDECRNRFPLILQEAAEEIVSLFPSERKDSYYIPYTVDKGSTRKFPARGKLYSRWVNSKRALTRSMNIPDSLSQGTRSKRHENIDEIEQSNYNILLQSTKDNTFEDCLTYWKSSFRMRQMKLKAFESALIYFNTFSVLRKPFGYKLLTNDFDIKYPNSKNISLHQIWPSIGSIVIDLLRSKANQVHELDFDNADKNFQSLTSFPYLFSPSQLRNKISNKLFKISKVEMSQRFFLQVESFADLDPKIAERKEKLKETGASIQPYMVAVGASPSIQAYLVIVDDQKYLVKDCLTALDTTFKIFHALDIPYATETKALWQTIDYLVYKVTNFLDPGASVVVGDIERGLNMIGK